MNKLLSVGGINPDRLQSLLQAATNSAGSHTICVFWSGFCIPIVPMFKMQSEGLHICDSKLFFMLLHFASCVSCVVFDCSWVGVYFVHLDALIDSCATHHVSYLHRNVWASTVKGRQSSSKHLQETMRRKCSSQKHVNTCYVFKIWSCEAICSVYIGVYVHSFKCVFGLQEFKYLAKT